MGQEHGILDRLDAVEPDVPGVSEVETNDAAHWEVFEMADGSNVPTYMIARKLPIIGDP